MFQIDQKSRETIYRQVVENIKELVIRGVLKPHDRLPSVRELSRKLMINPNTTAKAYRELESLGYIYTESGLGTFVADARALPTDMSKVDSGLEKVASGIMELHYLGMSDDEIEKAVRKLLEERRDNHDKD